MIRTLLITAAAALLTATPATAQEVFVGAYKHAVDTPFTLPSGEGGADFEAGYRFAPIQALRAIGRPSPYVLASVNTQGDTSFVGGGLSWKIEAGPVYIRPGIGLVIHTAPSYRVDPRTRIRTDLGSRVLFEPELGIGTRIGPRTSVEASWTHISNGQILGTQNPGIDMWGVRLNIALR